MTTPKGASRMWTGELHEVVCEAVSQDVQPKVYVDHMGKHADRLALQYVIRLTQVAEANGFGGITSAAMRVVMDSLGKA